MAEGRIGELEQQMAQQDQSLQAARKEAVKTDQAIKWVWIEVQRLGKAALGKRENSADEHAARQKKTKIEEDR